MGSDVDKLQDEYLLTFRKCDNPKKNPKNDGAMNKNTTHTSSVRFTFTRFDDSKEKYFQNLYHFKIWFDKQPKLL